MPEQTHRHILASAFPHRRITRAALLRQTLRICRAAVGVITRGAVSKLLPANAKNAVCGLYCAISRRHICAVRAFPASVNSSGHWIFRARLRAVRCLIPVAAHAELMSAAAGVRYHFAARGNKERTADKTPPLPSPNVRAGMRLRCRNRFH